MTTNAENAHIFCESIVKLAQNPQNLENLETYLSYHFSEWLEKYANTPDGIAGELKAFSEMEAS